ncbi:hypothetical protein [Andreprevotia sp. IGB-42]|uniref:hypothetical protein n=1 Tax=Andreprevotia sp. IGB-42 TaxID=2497473 RepID=UPI00135A7963|nr:hypothetical protein [Andreprevotia sp. IGB-42]
MTKRFHQPPSGYAFYDDTLPLARPDTSTPLLQAVVEFENSIRHNDFETGAFFSQDGTMLLRKEGLADQVGFGHENLHAMRNQLFTHNHPRGTTLSIEDIDLALDYQLSCIRVVGPRSRFIMYKPAKGWPPFTLVNDKFEKAKLGVHNEVRNLVNTDQLDRRNAGSEVLHLQLLQVCTELKLRYIREQT